MSQNIISHVRLKPFWLFLKINATSHSRSWGSYKLEELFV